MKFSTIIDLLGGEVGDLLQDFSFLEDPVLVLAVLLNRGFIFSVRFLVNIFITTRYNLNGYFLIFCLLWSWTLLISTSRG